MASQAHCTLPSAVPHPLASLVDGHGPVWGGGGGGGGGEGGEKQHK